MGNFEYYIINRKGDQAYPLIDEDPDCEITQFYLYRNYKKKIEDIQDVAKFIYAPPIPLNPVIGDYFSQPSSIVSEKIKNVLEAMDIDGIQMIPAEITTNKGDIIENYYYVHIYRWIKAIDVDNSDVQKLRDGTYIIEQFVLDNEILKEIPLNERLVFILEEDSGKMIYHKSVVDKILSVNPKGIQFTKVEDWEL